MGGEALRQSATKPPNDVSQSFCRMRDTRHFCLSLSMWVGQGEDNNLNNSLALPQSELALIGRHPIIVLGRPKLAKRGGSCFNYT